MHTIRRLLLNISFDESLMFHHWSLPLTIRGRRKKVFFNASLLIEYVWIATVSLVCCTNWRDALLTGKNHLYRYFVGSFPYQKPDSICNVSHMVLGFCHCAMKTVQGFQRSPRLTCPYCVNENHMCLTSEMTTLVFFRNFHIHRGTFFQPGYWCLFITHPLSGLSIYFTLLSLFFILLGASPNIAIRCFLSFVTQNKF